MAGRLGCFKRDFRATARLTGRIRKFDHVTDYIKRDVLHWLPFPQRIVYRVSVLVWGYLLGVDHAYLQELCLSTLDLHGRSTLRSSPECELFILRAGIAHI